MSDKQTKGPGSNFLTDADEAYAREIDALDPSGLGIEVTCPSCKAISWIKIPTERYGYATPIEITCPAACGYFAALTSFSPQATTQSQNYDVHNVCWRDKTETRTDGRIFRCPVCGIENPREVMRQCVDRITAVPLDATQEDLVEKLNSLVSTFDGVMRRCNSIAIHNQNLLGSSPHPTIGSFQDIAKAQSKLVSQLDLKQIVPAWDAFVATFQKRHAFSHTLGVADDKFIAKTGSSAGIEGKLVRITHDELADFAVDCQRIVETYFGHFLS